MGVRTDPTFRLCAAASPRCARWLAAVGQAQECSSQTVSGSLSQPFAHRGRSYWLPWAYLRVSRRACSWELVPSAYKSKDIYAAATMDVDSSTGAWAATCARGCCV